MAILLLDTVVEMQSVLETADTITAITAADPAVITVANTYTDGDLVVIDAVIGMVQINKRVVRVTASSGSGFTAEGLDSSGFTAYVSGGTSAEVSTLLTFDNATSFSFPEPSPNRIDVTPINATQKVEVFGLDEAPQITIPMIADPLAAHVVEMRAASIAKTNRVFRVTLQNGNILIFNGGVAGGRGFDGAVGAVGTSSLSVTLAATEQWFAS